MAADNERENERMKREKSNIKMMWCEFISIQTQRWVSVRETRMLKSVVDRSECKKNMMKIEKPFRLANEELE